MASNKARAYFSLGGYNFNPDQITQMLELEPTMVNNAGAFSSLDQPAISMWELSTEWVEDDIDIFRLTSDLIERIQPKKEPILKAIEAYNLSPRVGVVLKLSCDEEEPRPDVGFGAGTIRFLSDIGAFIHVDYDVR